MLDIQKKLSSTFLTILALPCTAIGFALSIQIQCLGWILNTQLGYDLHQIGLVWAAGPLAGILGQVIVGQISDNVWFWGGRRKPFIIIGGVIGAICLALIPNLKLIQTSFALQGTIMLIVATIIALSFDLSINISFNPTRSIIADVTPEGDLRTKGFTWMQTISGFFGMLAYLIGGFISNYVLLYLGIVVVFLFTVVPVFFIEEPKVLAPAKKADDVVEKESKANTFEFAKIFIAHAFTWFGTQTMFIYAFGYIKQQILGFGITAQLDAATNDKIGLITGISFAILNSVGFILPSALLEPLSKKIGKVAVHRLAIAVMALGYFGITLFAKSIIMLYILMAVVGVGWASVVSVVFAIMSETVDKRKMGLYMGIFNLSVVLPQLVASTTGKFFNGATNMIFPVCGASLAISAILWLTVKNNKETTISNVPSSSH